MLYNGLTAQEAKQNLTTFGLNEIVDVNKVSLLTILLRQVKNNFIVYLLLCATILSFIVGKSVTAYTIIGVIVLVVGAGFIQEYKAEKAVSALKRMIVPNTLVIRDSKEKEILSSEIVPGDILILRTGERIPADAVILSENNLLVNEAILTGESKEIKKLVSKDKENYVDENKVYMGSFIVSGKCIVKVTHTGMNTKFGEIAGMISSAEKELPLQDKINKITKAMAFIALSLAVLTGVLVLLKTPFITKAIIVDVIILVIAISVSAFPEGLPVVLITTLSSGAYRMAKKNAIVSRMSIIETLGETTVICSDKTGTITKGEMTVKTVFANNNLYDVTGIGFESKGEILLNNKKIDLNKNKELSLILKSSVLCNDAIIRKVEDDLSYKISGTPTEAALLILASKVEIFKDDFEVIRENEIPFSSERKMMNVLVLEKNTKTVYVKGAVEVLLNHCTSIHRNGRVSKLTKKDKDEILENNRNMTKKALRTLGFAYQIDSKNLESDLIFIGFVGMEDPPREEVKETILFCKKAGIKIKMITGDNKETATAIAKEIGILDGEVIDGNEMDALTDDELFKIIQNVVVFARVRPEHKLRIVKALKAHGEVVTMTGDGVNDAPALKEAHVGVAMGKTGTDVSRSVADLTLKDDNFATIVTAVKEGRTIFANLRKFMTYQLSCNFAELFIIIFGVILATSLGWPIPILLPLQILFMNIVTDNLPAIALGFNPSSNDIMDERPKKRNILTKNLIFLLLFSSIIIAGFTLIVYYVTFNVLGFDAIHATTTALLTLILLEILGAFIYRSFRKGVFRRSLVTNKYLFFASLISILATIAIIYTPLNKLFGTIPLGITSWLVAIGVGFLFIIIFDILKAINNKKRFWVIES